MSDEQNTNEPQIIEKKQANGRKILPISIRNAEQEDVSFIFSSWLKSFKNDGFSKMVPATIYFSEHHKLIEKLLKRCNCIVAVAPNDAATIYGYMVYEVVEGAFVVHYTYTKHPFRALGVAKQLLAHTEHDFKNAGGLFTHTSFLASKLSLKYNLIYHPYIFINYGG